MNEPNDSLAEALPLEDCPLPIYVQRRNIGCYALFWSVYYLCAPVTYIGLTHANLLKALGNSDKISNLPSAMYYWVTIVPVVVAWLFPHQRHLKPLVLIALGLMMAMTAIVALVLWLPQASVFASAAVVSHGAVFGCCGGVVFSALWDCLRRGVSTSRRGAALGYAFGIGPLFACAGSLWQDAVFDGNLLGGHSLGLGFPNNYMILFVSAVPLLLIAGGVMGLFTLPVASAAEVGSGTPLAEITAGFRQFFRNRNLWFVVVIYVVVYSGGNAIFPNVSLYAKDVLGQATNTLGLQGLLRFGVKAAAGGMLGWLLTAASPRATLVATTSILLVGTSWALNSTGWWYMATFGILGAGELFGAYFPNYVTTASEKKFVRVNIAYLSVLTTVVGFSSVGFGAISDAYGLIASFKVAAGILVFGLALIFWLPLNPTPRETTPPSNAHL